MKTQNLGPTDLNITRLCYGAMRIAGGWDKDKVDAAAIEKGISALEPMLIAPDGPVLSANSADGTVITKEKSLQDGSRYLISYNHSGNSVTATFTLHRPARTISVVAGENRSISPDQSTSFKDTYAPFQAHVYKID